MIILTSFENSKKMMKRQMFQMVSSVNLYSVSRNQPAGFSYIDLPFLAARDVQGNKLTLKDGIDVYKEKLMEFYRSVWDSDIVPWVMELVPGNIDIVCCWCPYSNSTRKQMSVYNSFVCHTGIIGDVINDINPDIEVYMDMDRHNYLISEYKPDKYKLFIM
jgi:hypothetical protein